MATKLFSERGFEKTSISAICEIANVSNGLVFHHFKNKNELLREFFKKTTNIIIEINQDINENVSPKKRLIELIDAAFNQMVEDKLFFQLYLNVMLQPSTRVILIDLINERSAFLLKSAEDIFSKASSKGYEVHSYMFVSVFGWSSNLLYILL